VFCEHLFQWTDKTFSGEDFKNPKPHKECFHMVKKEDIFVGNSFNKDLLIPKSKGAVTIHLTQENSKADYTIKEIYDIEKIFSIIK